MIDITTFIWIACLTDPEPIRGDPGDPRSEMRKIGKDRLQDRQLCPVFPSQDRQIRPFPCQGQIGAVRTLHLEPVARAPFLLRELRRVT
jgi:hypothetical protein